MDAGLDIKSEEEGRTMKRDASLLHAVIFNMKTQWAKFFAIFAVVIILCGSTSAYALTLQNGEAAVFDRNGKLVKVVKPAKSSHKKSTAKSNTKRAAPTKKSHSVEPKTE
jgi:hypothetical protein